MSDKKEIRDLEEAKRHFHTWTKFRVEMPIEKGGEKLAYRFRRPAPPHETYVVTFKRQWYNNFSFHLPHVPKKDYGKGQISNLKLLLFCKKSGVSWLIAVMPNGRVYKIDPQQFLAYHNEHNTEVPHLPGEVAAPIKMWKRMF